MPMRKQMIVAIFIAACIIFSVISNSMALESLAKPTVTVPTNWSLKEETPYPDATTGEHDPQGAGFLNYYDAYTNAFVLIYYESALGVTYSYNDLSDEALTIFQRKPIYPMEDSGVMDVAGVPAGYVKGHDTEYDLYYLEIIFVKNNYYFDVRCGYAANSPDETDVNSLINSINVGAEGGGFPIGYIIIGVVAAVVVAVVVAVVIILLKRRKKPVASMPVQLRIAAEPLDIIADGKTQSVITLQLLDEKGCPIPASADTQVQITATKGVIQDPMVVIPKGKDAERTVIVSSRESGQVPVTAQAEGLKGITITLNFTERQRYCMHCGARMPYRFKACQNCGKVPPAGVDTKVCHNCKSVIPIVAKFCSECGAGQVA
jgi:ribosomal protein L40E